MGSDLQYRAFPGSKILTIASTDIPTRKAPPDMTSTNQRFENLDATPLPRFTPSPLRGHELLDAVLAHISSLPQETDGDETWDQAVWLSLDADTVQRLFDERSDALTPLDPTNVRSGLKLSPEVAITECGTAACFAGHAGLMVGDSPVVKVDRWTDYDDNGNPIEKVSIEDRWDVLVDMDGKVRPVRERAQDLLGLEYYQAECLFHANNTIHDLRTIIEWIKDGVEGRDIVERYRDEIGDRI